MKHPRTQQAASVVRASTIPPLWRETAIRRQIAQDFEETPDLLEPGITPEEAEEIRRMDRERIAGDQRIYEWLMSLPHTPPVRIEDMPTLAHETAWYAGDTTEVPSEPALR